MNAYVYCMYVCVWVRIREPLQKVVTYLGLRTICVTRSVAVQ